MQEKRDFTISRGVIEKIARRIEPSLFYAADTGTSVIEFEISSPKDKDPYLIAEEIAKKSGAKLVNYHRGDKKSTVAFSLGEHGGPKVQIDELVLGELRSECGFPRRITRYDSDRDCKNSVEVLEKEVEDYLNRVINEAIFSAPKRIKKLSTASNY